MAKKKGEPKVKVSEQGDVKVQISPPKFGRTVLTVIGVSPLVINAFPAKAREQMKRKQKEGHQSRKGQKREPKDFDLAFQQAHHESTDGWYGIAAPAFRNAMISACRTVGFKMTLAKLSIFIEADGFDKNDGTPLVRITKGNPKYVEHLVRNESGVADIRPRPMWEPGWEANVRIRWDDEQFNTNDIVNLLARAGMQVGICEGRPDSPNSNGLGWGLFDVKPS